MFDVIVEHPIFGRGEIVEIDYDTGKPLVLVRWYNDNSGYYLVEELDFLVV